MSSISKTALWNLVCDVIDALERRLALRFGPGELPHASVATMYDDYRMHRDAMTDHFWSSRRRLLGVLCGAQSAAHRAPVPCCC